MRGLADVVCDGASRTWGVQRAQWGRLGSATLPSPSAGPAPSSHQDRREQHSRRSGGRATESQSGAADQSERRARPRRKECRRCRLRRGVMGVSVGVGSQGRQQAGSSLCVYRCLVGRPGLPNGRAGRRRRLRSRKLATPRRTRAPGPTGCVAASKVGMRCHIGLPSTADGSGSLKMFT